MLFVCVGVVLCLFVGCDCYVCGCVVCSVCNGLWLQVFGSLVCCVVFVIGVLCRVFNFGLFCGCCVCWFCVCLRCILCLPCGLFVVCG